MINAKEAREKSESIVKKQPQKLLEVNRDKEFFICLPFKMPIVKETINRAIMNGLTSVKIHNEITPEVEEEIISKGFKVKYFKSYIKISW